MNHGLFWPKSEVFCVYVRNKSTSKKFYTEEFIEVHLVNNFVSHCFATNAMCEAETGFQMVLTEFGPIYHQALVQKETEEVCDQI